MYYIANDILKNTHEAEDVVQNSIIKIANYIEKIDDINCNKTKSLIVTIVKSTSIDVYRKKKDNYIIDIDETGNRIESDEPPLDDLIIRLEESEELSKKLAELKSEYADILMLKYYHQFNDKEIAGVLSLKNENVRIRIYRAKIALKKVMLKD
jgi:RNA polymerase sigma-70 factor (ECF subfamily)